MSQPYHRLGDLRTSEDLISELYLDLRKTIHRWSSLTHQTAQARMGYVGQHLVSVVTGLPGGKSGARGSDLVEPDGGKSEIKTCYRVDQLGKCRTCGAGISPREDSCPSCGGDDLQRMDDSKWLISIRNGAEFASMATPKTYYFALFEFEDLRKAENIIATIYQVDPKSPGFCLCMADYYLAIRANSVSKAPLNIWPHQVKFLLMAPELIYASRIGADNKIETLRFPGREAPVPCFPKSLAEYSRSTGLSSRALVEALGELGEARDLTVPKPKLIEAWDAATAAKGMGPRDRAALLSRKIYGPSIQGDLANIANPLGDLVRSYSPF